jgi:hypothetical protein
LCEFHSGQSAAEVIATLRAYPVFANPFFETSGKMSCVPNALGVILLTVPVATVFIVASQLFYTVTLPQLLGQGNASWTRAINYFVGQFALVLSSCIVIVTHKKASVLLLRIASSPSVATQKNLALNAPTCFLLGGYVLYLFAYWYRIWN